MWLSTVGNRRFVTGTICIEEKPDYSMKHRIVLSARVIHLVVQRTSTSPQDSEAFHSVIV